MKLDELLQEETLQAAVKRLLKPAGTLKDVMGRDAQAAATLLGAKPGDEALKLSKGSPQSERMLKAVVNSRPYETSDSDDHGKLRVMRMPGGAKLLVVGEDDDAFVVTTTSQKDNLVEEADHWVFTVGEDDGARSTKGDAAKIAKKILSTFKRDMKEADEPIDPSMLEKWSTMTDPAQLYHALIKADLAWDGYALKLEKNGKEV